MSSRMSRNKAAQESNVFFLTQVLENKELLFGKKFNNSSGAVDDRAKKDKWVEIWNNCCERGLFADRKCNEDVGGAWLRAKRFSNMKTDLKGKVDRAKQRYTGVGGGSQAKFTEADKLLIQIIGEDSHEMTGLRVEEMTNKPSVKLVVDVMQTQGEDIDTEETVGPIGGTPMVTKSSQSTAQGCSSSNRKRATNVSSGRKMSEAEQAYTQVVKRLKVDLLQRKCDLLLLKCRDMSLRIYKHEKKLGLEHLTCSVLVY